MKSALYYCRTFHSKYISTVRTLQNNNNLSFLFSYCFARIAVTHLDYHHHHRHLHTVKPALYSLLPFCYPPFFKLPTTHPLFSGPLPDDPPRLRSGCQLPPHGVGVRSWGTRLTNPWRMMRRECGLQTLSRASRKPWPSIHHVAAGRSSSPMRARCTVWKFYHHNIVHFFS